MYRGGFNVMEPPIVAEPRVIRRVRPPPVNLPVVRKIRRPVVDRRVVQVAPPRRPLIKKTYVTRDDSFLPLEPMTTVLPLVDPVYDIGPSRYEQDFWNPPEIVRTRRSTPTYTNYQVKRFLPPPRETFYNFPEIEFENEILRDSGQAFVSDYSYDVEPAYYRHRDLLRPSISMPERPTFYYHRPRVQVPRRIEYLDDVYDSASMVPFYSSPRRERF